nr:aldehyde:ferredoxin oxidoreductase [Bacillota bacterium]
ALDSLDLCMFCFGVNLIFCPNDVVELLNLCTGWDATLWELMLIGERRINMFRAFNAREGFTIEDDALPEREFEPLVGGTTEGDKVDREAYFKAREQYFRIMGWDEKTGLPGQDKLAELGLDWI